MNGQVEQLLHYVREHLEFKVPAIKAELPACAVTPDKIFLGEGLTLHLEEMALYRNGTMLVHRVLGDYVVAEDVKLTLKELYDIVGVLCDRDQSTSICILSAFQYALEG